LATEIRRGTTVAATDPNNMHGG